MDSVSNILLDYLNNSIYNPDKAHLDLDNIPESFRPLAKSLSFYAEKVQEMRSFAQALSCGDLNIDNIPSPENELAAPLKSLHANLRHLTWQAKQVAEGDYKQRVDFMGEFSEAFNTMIIHLERRQKELEAEIELNKKKALSLQQSNNIFESLTEMVMQWIIVIDCKTNEIIFINNAASKIISHYGNFPKEMLNRFIKYCDGDNEQPYSSEVTIYMEGSPVYLAYKCYPINWNDRDALACIFTDISNEKIKQMKLENVAYVDSLTNTFSRYYGMKILQEWIDKKVEFCLCYIDIDGMKFVNDTFGHEMGDKYIIDVAQTLSGYSQDAVVCRIGGDEFLILIKNKGAKSVKKKLETISHNLEKKLEIGDSFFLRSISFGIVEVKKNNTLNKNELLCLADERMYKYKRMRKRSYNFKSEL